MQGIEDLNNDIWQKYTIISRLEKLNFQRGDKVWLNLLCDLSVTVDWATLAQQWIRMKETLPVDQVPPAPPPPSIKADIEAGEAPMDMSKDDGSPGRNPDAPSQGKLDILLNKAQHL